MLSNNEGNFNALMGEFCCDYQQISKSKSRKIFANSEP